jgi:hypothetical protein
VIGACIVLAVIIYAAWWLSHDDERIQRRAAPHNSAAQVKSDFLEYMRDHPDEFVD